MFIYNHDEGDVKELKLSPHTMIKLWEDLYHKKQELWLTVLSGSMMPLLQCGDKVLVQSVKPHDIRLGDIIVFKNSDKLETHRVIRKYSNSSFLQKGDNAMPAEIVTSKQLVGKVIAIKKGNRIIRFDGKIEKMINYILTFFSFSTYYFNQKNSATKKIVLVPLNKMKKIFNYWINRKYRDF